MRQIPPTLVPGARRTRATTPTRGPTSTSAGCCSTPLYYAFGALAVPAGLRRGRGVRAVQAAPGARQRRSSALMLATLMIPATVLIVPQYVTVDRPADPAPQPARLAVGDLAAGGGQRVQHLPAQAVLRLDPEELLAAAAIDGASPLRTLWSIVLPMSRPILGVVSIFAVVGGVEGLPLAAAGRCRTTRDRETVNVGIYAFASGTPQNVVHRRLRRSPPSRPSSSSSSSSGTSCPA